MTGGGRDADVLENIRPPFSRPQAAGDGHVALDGFHFIPTLEAAMGIDNEIAKLAHGHCPISRCVDGPAIAGAGPPKLR
jgi:hypothetical protein